MYVSVTVTSTSSLQLSETERVKASGRLIVPHMSSAQTATMLPSSTPSESSMTGAVVSLTMMVKLCDVLLPQASVAVRVTRCS